MDISSTVLLICIKCIEMFLQMFLSWNLYRTVKTIVPNKFWAEWKKLCESVCKHFSGKHIVKLEANSHLCLIPVTKQNVEIVFDCPCIWA
jgi:hypothetical protein